jgi:uncharacterized protein (TIGR02996 family)
LSQYTFWTFLPFRRPTVTTTDPCQAFEAHIAKNPFDPNLHLIYADWLEEQGLLDEGTHERFVGMTLQDPYNGQLRRQYADWLDSHGLRREAEQERWLSGAFWKESLDDLALITRERIVSVGRRQVRDWYEETYWEEPILTRMNYWLKRAREIFEANPGVFFMVVAPYAPTQCGFSYVQPGRRGGRRLAYLSPVLFYRQAGRSRSSRQARVLVA